MKKIKYTKGSLILKENSAGEEIYFIVSGKVKVFKTIGEEKLELGVLGINNFFGEMSMFLQHKRSASVEALEDSVLVVGNKNEFINAIKKNPDKAILIISTLVKRIKRAHDLICELEGQAKGFEILLTPFK